MDKRTTTTTTTTTKTMTIKPIMSSSSCVSSWDNGHVSRGNRKKTFVHEGTVFIYSSILFNLHLFEWKGKLVFDCREMVPFLLNEQKESFFVFDWRPINTSRRFCVNKVEESTKHTHTPLDLMANGRQSHCHWYYMDNVWTYNLLNVKLQCLFACLLAYYLQCSCLQLGTIGTSESKW